ncbi:MAG: hypothetical protein M3478_13405, partial [Planctomycetota bacterium]|nr:hypothetical protein [Planctomycetota bacterium]
MLDSTGERQPHEDVRLRVHVRDLLLNGLSGPPPQRIGKYPFARLRPRRGRRRGLNDDNYATGKPINTTA